MSVGMGDKITLTALQLLYVIERAIDDALDEVEANGTVNAMQIANEATIEIFRKRKEADNGNE